MSATRGSGARAARQHVPGEVDTTHGAILYVEGVTVSFDGFKALDDLSLSLDDGELRCIIGPNGAGKTTLMDIVTGKTRPDSGTVFFGSTIDLTSLSESEIVKAGVGRKFQKPTVFEQHTVSENLELALEGNKGVWHSLLGRVSSAARDRIDEVAETIGLQNRLAQAAGDLSHGQKQWLEIGMLLAQDPRLLLVDEPAAGMTPAEREHTTDLLKRAAEKHAVVVVEHDMEFIRRLDCRVTVLCEGSVLAEGSLDHVTSNPEVIEVYLGR